MWATNFKLLSQIKENSITIVTLLKFVNPYPANVENMVGS
jgi:hypothetical protein